MDGEMGRGPGGDPGLTSAEVDERRRQGLVNDDPPRTSRPVALIIRSNVFTRFNAILGTLLAVIIVVGPFQDSLFAFVLVINTLLGIVQELRAKWTLDRLAVVHAPMVHVRRDAVVVAIAARDIVIDDVVELERGDQVPVDGTVLEGSLELDESLLSGETDPVDRPPGVVVRSGSFVVAGSGAFRVTAVGAESYAQRLAGEARRFSLARSELEDGVDLLLRYVQWALLPVAALLIVSQLLSNQSLADAIRGCVAGVGAMIPEGLVLLTTVAFGLGAVRLARRHVLVQELPAVEGLARIDVLCLDKTGTLTKGLIEAVGFTPVARRDRSGAGVGTDARIGVDAPAAAEAPVGADARVGVAAGAGAGPRARADGRGIEAVLGAMAAAESRPNPTLAAIGARWPAPADDAWSPRRTVAFSSTRRWSAVEFASQGTWVLGAPDALTTRDLPTTAGTRSVLLAQASGPLGQDGGLPARLRAVAVVHLVEEVRDDARPTIEHIVREGVAVKVMSGDHPETVAAVAAAVGVPGADQPVDAGPLTSADLDTLLESRTVFGRVSPAQKQAMVASLQARGHVVAMIGDGVNDVPALKDADIGVAMGSGSAATRAVAQLVLLDDAFTSLPAAIGEGRRVLANVERAANLFITKTVYATLIAAVIGVSGVAYPFLPRHLTIVSDFSIGIPAFFLALMPNSRRFVPGFVGRVLRFTIPCGVTVGIAALTAYFVASASNVPLIQGRTMATMVLATLGLWILTLLARPFNRYKAILVGGLAAGLAGFLAIPGLRSYFALSFPPAVPAVVAVMVTLAAGVVLELLYANLRGPVGLDT